MVTFITILFSLGVGFGLSCLICGALLNRSNNFGDSKGDKMEYRAYADFKIRNDKLTASTYRTFVADYSLNIDKKQGPQGTELVRRLTPEELQQYNMSSGAPMDTRDADRFGKPISESLKGVFSPLEDEDDTGF